MPFRGKLGPGGGLACDDEVPCRFFSVRVWLLWVSFLGVARPHVLAMTSASSRLGGPMANDKSPKTRDPKMEKKRCPELGCQRKRGVRTTASLELSSGLVPGLAANS